MTTEGRPTGGDGQPHTDRKAALIALIRGFHGDEPNGRRAGPVMAAFPTRPLKGRLALMAMPLMPMALTRSSTERVEMPCDLSPKNWTVLNWSFRR